MNLNLEGKTVIVTGGGSNIGRAISHCFGEERANVVIADFDEAQGAKTTDEIKKQGGEVLFVRTDVTNWDQVVAMVKKTNEAFGPIDILVNCVGWNVDQLFMEETREKWEKVIAINLWGVINCTRAVLDQMIERKGGVVVNIGSDAGRMGEFREVVYAGAKGGVIAITKALAREMGRYGIRLNVVCPGTTVPESKEQVGEKSLWAGDMIKMFTPEVLQKVVKVYPLRKLGKAEDIANAVAFMASDRAGHITGQTLSVSGGYTMM